MMYSNGFCYNYGQRLDHLNCVIKSRESDSYGNLFLGDLTAASSDKILKSNKIRAVLTIGSEIKLEYPESTILCHYSVNIDDETSADFLPHFNMIVQFIDVNLDRTNVLVHCQQGINRSATAVLAFVMKKYEMPYDQAFRLVQEQRKGIFPNIGFIKQLKKFYAIFQEELRKTEEDEQQELENQKYKLVSLVISDD